jgi:hypothetical protein
VSAAVPTEQKRSSPPVILGAALTCLLASVLAFLPACSGEPPRSDASPELRRPGPAGVPDIEHARWRVDKFSAGSLGRATKADRRRLKVQGPKVGALVRSIYDTLFLQPARTERVVRARFATPAARSFMRTGAGLPPGAERVALVSRRARIGIDARTTSRAVASVLLRATGWRDAQRFRLLHRATLWVERSPGGWRVFAYDIAQEPARA